MGLFDKVFGSHSDKELKRISKTVDKIEALDASMQQLSDEELRHKTVEFKERLANGDRKSTRLNSSHNREFRMPSSA